MEHWVEIILILFILVLVYFVVRLSTAKSKLVASYQAKLKTITKEKVENQDVLNSSIQFAEKIGQGELDTHFDTKEDDELGKALLSMRDNLKQAALLESQQAWVSEGLSKASEILRTHAGNLNELCRQMNNFLIQYTSANQGGVFVINEDESPVLELKACYAYSREKFIDKTFKKGEGFIGQCWVEQQTIYMTDIPAGYIDITSGLGDATPDAIIIVPLSSNEVIEGVWEMAFFKKLEEHEIQFLEKVGENFASFIASIRGASQTNLLLQEMEKAKVENEKAQEAINAQLEVLDNVVSISKTDLEGNIIYVNNMFLSTSGYTEKELMGKNHRILKSPDTSAEVFVELWRSISHGITWQGEIKNLNKDLTVSWSDCIIAPLKNSQGEIIEYMSVRFPINEKKKREEKMAQMFESVQEEQRKTEEILNGAVDTIIVLNQSGHVDYINTKGEELFQENKKLLIGQYIPDLLPITIDQQNKSIYVNQTQQEIDIRTEMSFEVNGEEKDVLVSNTKFEIKEKEHFVLFIQNITVDLF